MCAALWGSAFPVIKISYEKLSIAQEDIFSKIYFAGIRFFIASLLVFLAARLLFRMPLKIRRDQVKFIVLLGLLQTSLQYFFFYIGIANTSGIKSAILQSGSTFFVVVAAHFIYRDDKMDMRKVVSLILGFGGIVLINIGKGFDLHFKLLGEGFLIGTALVSAFATFFVKGISKKINPVILTGGQMFAGSLFLLAVGKIGMGARMLAFDKVSLGLLLYASFLSATAFLLWYTLLKYNRAGELSIYRLFIPVFGALFSVLFIEGEVLTGKLLGGLALVVAGMIVLNLKRENGHFEQQP